MSGAPGLLCADDLAPGTPLPTADVTITAGHVAVYESIAGPGLALSTNRALGRAVIGHDGVLVDPTLVMQFVIGQSTVATRSVIANLFYRDVVFAKQVCLGTTLTTSVRPVAVARSTGRPGSPPRGKVLLAIEAHDQHGDVVVRFQRAALLPVRAPDALCEHGEVGRAVADAPLDGFAPAVPSTWRLVRPDLPHGLSRPGPDTVVRDSVPEPVTDALALVRITGNLAAAHRAAAFGQHGRRLVYGGHTIALAQAAVRRALPDLATVIGWRSCSHLAPVFEEDVLHFDVAVGDELPLPTGGTLCGLVVTGTNDDGTTVIDWRPVVLRFSSPS